MKHGAITFAFLLAAGAAGGVAFTGCSSDPAPANPTPGTDAAVDSVAIDSKPVDTGKPDVPAPSCAAPIEGFACEAAADRTGKTVCTDEMIKEFMNCFGTSGDEAKCTAARTKYPQCNTCVLTDWLKVNPDTGGGSLDVAACIKKVDPTGPCSGATNCYYDCNDWVCSECDDTPGSGKTGSMSSSAALECERDARSAGSSTKPKGACYDIAYKEFTTCQSDERFRYCFVRTLADLEFFLRGACRDGGNWSNVTVDKPTDAGVTDTGTLPTDTGSDTLGVDTALPVDALGD